MMVVASVVAVTAEVVVAAKAVAMALEVRSARSQRPAPRRQRSFGSEHW